MKNAFLLADLEEEVYMTVLLGLEEDLLAMKFVKLRRFFMALSPRA